MAEVSISEDEAAEGVLPPVCLVCGADAPIARPVVYRWAPRWTHLALPFGVLPWAVLRFAMSRSLLVHTPLCGRHGLYWVKRAAVVPAGVLLSFGLLVCGVALGDNGSRIGWSLLSAFGALVATLAASLAMAGWGARVSVVTGRAVTFAGASARFVAAVEAGRADYERRRQAWLARA